MTSIAENITQFRKTLPDNVLLIAVSKTKPESDILEAYNAGQRVFGENKVQELVTKAQNLPGEIKWHFIGHLQTNKVKQVLPYTSLIHAVDSLRLMKEIDKEAGKIKKQARCLLQFHIASEESKFGFSLEEAEEIFQNNPLQEFLNIEFCGVMGMATFTDNLSLVRKEFKTLFDIYQSLKKKYFVDSTSFSEISMGMSDDYKIAIEEGATMIRIGSSLFGERNYH